MAGPEITREVYKSVKKFDRKEFQEFCTDVYKQGYLDGRESVPGVDVVRLYEVIASIPGIGVKRLSMIKEAVDMAFVGGLDGDVAD